MRARPIVLDPTCKIGKHVKSSVSIQKRPLVFRNVAPVLNSSSQHRNEGAFPPRDLDRRWVRRGRRLSQIVDILL